MLSQGAASVVQTDALGDSLEIARLDAGHYFGEVRQNVAITSSLERSKGLSSRAAETARLGRLSASYIRHVGLSALGVTQTSD